MDPTEAFTGSATDWSVGDLTSVVAIGSTDVIVRFKNTSDVSMNLHVRKTGSSYDHPENVLPWMYSPDIHLTLTSARTLEYKLEGGGSISCEVVDYSGTGLTPSSIVYSDIRDPYLLGYTTDDISNASITSLATDIINEVTDAATRHQNIAGFAVNTTIKNYAIKLGTAVEVLRQLRNKGASTGLVQGNILVSDATIEDYGNKYKEILSGIRSGIKYGA